VLAALIPGAAFARTRRRRWRKHRRQRRKRHRRVRRRIRRRVTWRALGKRRVVVAPKAPRPGWELAVAAEQPGAPDEVVVVKEVKPDVLVVAAADGSTRNIEYVPEDTPENSRDLEGSVLPEGDAAPYLESDIEEWEEYDPD